MVKNWIGKLYAKTGGSNRLERIWKLAEVDFKKRYYNDKLGILWTILNPLFQITIFYFVFKYIRDSREENFVFFLYLGIITFGSYSFMSKQGLNIFRKKMYLLESIQFKKIDIFISGALTGFMTTSIDFIVYIVVAYFFNATYNLFSFYAIILISLTILLGLATSMLLSVIKLYFHDIQNIWSLLNFALFWVSGIIFSGKILLEAFPLLLYINPLVGLLINMRNILLYGHSINLEYLLINICQCAILLTFAYIILKRRWHLILERI